MAALDVFFSREDQHRVVLLQQVLEDAGVALELHTEAFEPTSAPVLGVLSEHAQPWMVRQAIECAERLIWLRLDHAPLPAPASQALALQNWPGRSADLAIAELVEALRAGWQPADTMVPADPPALETDATVAVSIDESEQATASQPPHEELDEDTAPAQASERESKPTSIRRGAAERSELGGRVVGLLVVMAIVFGFWGLTQLAPDGASSARKDTDRRSAPATTATGSYRDRSPAPVRDRTVTQAPAPRTPKGKSDPTPCIELARSDPLAAQELLVTLDAQARLACRAALREAKAWGASSDPLVRLCVARDEATLETMLSQLEPELLEGPIPECLRARAERSTLKDLDFARPLSPGSDSAGA